VSLIGKVTEHFSWSELCLTEHRDYVELNAKLLEADDEARRALYELCRTLLEPVRKRFGPVIVHSAYRCAALNTEIGGSVTSQHINGEAADFHCLTASLTEVFDWIRRHPGLPFGQVILEGRIPSWIHLSLGEPWRPRSACRQILRWDGAKYSIVS